MFSFNLIDQIYIFNRYFFQYWTKKYSVILMLGLIKLQIVEKLNPLITFDYFPSKTQFFGSNFSPFSKKIEYRLISIKISKVRVHSYRRQQSTKSKCTFA